MTIGFLPKDGKTKDNHAYVFMTGAAGHLVPSNHLHLYVWEFFAGQGIKQRPAPNEVIHHVNGVHDNRVSKLDRLPRWLHNRRHHRERQKWSPKREPDVQGFHRALPPGPVTERLDLIGLGVPINKTADKNIKDWRTGLSAAELKAEVVLADLLPGLRRRLRRLESSKKIPMMAPKMNWRDPATRRLGIRQPRLGCSPGEAALVYLLVEHDGDIALVAAATGIEQGVLENINMRPAVQVARERWRTNRRFPRPCPRPTARP